MNNSSREFKKKNYNKKFYILLNDRYKYNGLRIKEGLNIYKNSLYSNKKSIEGYNFISLEDISRSIDKKTKYIAEIKILNDSRIDDYYGNLYINKVIFNNILFIKDFKLWKDENFCKKAVKVNILNLKYINYKNKRELYEKKIRERGFYLSFIEKKNQYYNLCKLAITNNKEIFKYVRKDLQDYDLCKKAIEDNGYNLEYVRNDLKNIELCDLAINDNIMNFMYYKKELQTYDLCCYVVSKFSGNLKYVREDLQDYNLCKMALEKDMYSFKYIRSDLQTLELFLKHRGENFNNYNFKFLRQDLQNYKLCKYIVKKDSDYIKYVRKDLQNISLCDTGAFRSLKFYGDNIRYIKKSLHTEKMCENAIRFDIDNFKFINKNIQTYEMCKNVIKHRINLNFIRIDLLNKDLFIIVIDKCINKK